jgi:hypothetical protein
LDVPEPDLLVFVRLLPDETVRDFVVVRLVVLVRPALEERECEVENERLPPLPRLNDRLPPPPRLNDPPPPWPRRTAIFHVELGAEFVPCEDFESPSSFLRAACDGVAEAIIKSAAIAIANDRTLYIWAPLKMHAVYKNTAPPNLTGQQTISVLYPV